MKIKLLFKIYFKITSGGFLVSVATMELLQFLKHFNKNWYFLCTIYILLLTYHSYCDLENVAFKMKTWRSRWCSFCSCNSLHCPTIKKVCDISALLLQFPCSYLLMIFFLRDWRVSVTRGCVPQVTMKHFGR